MTFTYCPDCGTKAVPKLIGDEGEMPYCPACEKPLFSFSYPCVITIVTDGGGSFAFIRQYNIPEGRHICVAGYLKAGETPEETVGREVEEEIGLPVKDIYYIKSYHHTKKDQLMLGFAALVEHGEFRLSPEVDSARWFTADEAMKVLPENSIAESVFVDYLRAQAWNLQ